MKNNNYSLLMIIALSFLLFFAGTNQKHKRPDRFLTDTYYSSNILETNQIYISLTNTGNVDWDGIGGYVVWTQIDMYKMIVFDQGLWVIGQIENHPYWGYGRWRSVYSPGPMIDGQAAMLANPEDSLRYRVYKISEDDDDSNPDYLEWPDDYGAPLNNQGEPKVFGKQTLWTVYNAMDSTISYRENNRDTIAVMPVEVNQTIYARGDNVSDAEDIFSNIVFLEYQVINKGDKDIDSTYIGFWTDIDFLIAQHNPPAVDTLRQLGYCWYSEDDYEGVIPPAIGYVQLYGPSVPSSGDNAMFKGKTLDNYRNLKLSSFLGIEDDASASRLFNPPYTVEEAWNSATGFDLDGNNIIDPTTGQPTKFPLSGDPATNTGWIYPNGTGGGAGFAIYSGPFTLAPGDTQWVMYALVPGLGQDRFQSINAMRAKAAFLHKMPYDSLVHGKRTVGIWYNGEAEITLDKTFIKPQMDSLIVTATFPNSDQSEYATRAVITNIEGSYLDTLNLYDDGLHHDQEAGDGIWGNVLPPIENEDYFTISLVASDLNTSAFYFSDQLAAFTSVGPVIYKDFNIVTSDTIPSPGDRVGIQLQLENVGLVASALNVSSNLISFDTSATISPGLDNPSYGDIAAGESALGDRTGFITFTEDCPDSSWNSFKVEIYSNDMLFWTDTFAIFVQSEPTGMEQIGKNTPTEFTLSQNYPNPFNPKTIINYELPISNDVELSIFNVLGQKIATLVSERLQAGYYQVEWDAAGFSSGIYYYMIRAGDFQEIKKMVLVR
jgi:hypothetical protein